VQLDSLKELYASKTDDELLSLAAEKSSLVEIARLALADELRRGQKMIDFVFHRPQSKPSRGLTRACQCETETALYMFCPTEREALEVCQEFLQLIEDLLKQTRSRPW
jgi:hypothetical protein